MSAEAISESTFIREFTRELHNRNTAIFAGAGLSMASGYVDWKGLLKDLITDLGLDPDKEDDLVTLAQYHCNQAGGEQGPPHPNHFRPFRANPHTYPQPRHPRTPAHLHLLDYELRQID